MIFDISIWLWKLKRNCLRLDLCLRLLLVVLCVLGCDRVFLANINKFWTWNKISVFIFYKLTFVLFLLMILGHISILIACSVVDSHFIMEREDGSFNHWASLVLVRAFDFVLNLNLFDSVVNLFFKSALIYQSQLGSVPVINCDETSEIFVS